MHQIRILKVQPQNPHRKASVQMKAVIFILLIITILWILWEIWHKQSLLYFIAKKDIQTTEEEIAECLKSVLINLFRKR